MSTVRHSRPNANHDYEFLREYSRPPLDARTQRLDTIHPLNPTWRLCRRRASSVEVRGRDSPERDATNQLAKALPRESSSEEEDVVGRRNAYVCDIGDERANDASKQTKCGANERFCRFTSYCTRNDLRRGRRERESENRALPARRRYSRFTFGFTRIQRL